MATDAVNRMIVHLRRAALVQERSALTDGELLECYVCRREEASFEALVGRHGPMVLAVCRRILRNEADAEDAFQATFLVLVRKASSIQPRSQVSNWLYGVAHKTALKARAMIRKRRIKEREAGGVPKPEATREVWQQVQAMLDAKLSQLPDKYRLPIVLCELEGKTIKEASRHLGWPYGTVATRLARGRALLAKRLSKHGLELSGGVLAALLSQDAASASVPTSLMSSTVKAATIVATGGAAAVVSAQVAALTEGVLNMMLFSKLKSLAAVSLLVVGLGFGLGIGYGQIPQTRTTPDSAQPEAGRKPGAQATDSAKLQGAWKVLRIVRDGNEAEAELKQGVARMYVVKDKIYEMYEGNGKNWFQNARTFSVDPNEKPATIDLTDFRANPTIKAIYRLDGDTLTLCRPFGPGIERPTKLASEKDSHLELLELKRDPKAPKLDLDYVNKEQQIILDRRPVAVSLLKIVTAMHFYREEKGAYPARAIFDGKEKPLLSWRVAILPYLGDNEKALYEKFKLDEPWDSEHNKQLLSEMPQVYGDGGTETVYQVFVGDGTAFDGTKAAKIEDFRDGVDDTILVAVATQPVPWTKPADLPYAADKPLPKLGGIDKHDKNGFHVATPRLMVRFVPSKFNEKALRACITIAGGETEGFKDLQSEDSGQKKSKDPAKDGKNGAALPKEQPRERLAGKKTGNVLDEFCRQLRDYKAAWQMSQGWTVILGKQPNKDRDFWGDIGEWHVSVP